MKIITTYSGAVYKLHDDGRTITGGSKDLKDGHLLTEPRVGHTMMISTPERHHLNPHFGTAGVITTRIISIEDNYSRWDAIGSAVSTFLGTWRNR